MDEIEKAFRYAINIECRCWTFAVVVFVLSVNIQIGFGLREIFALVTGLFTSAIIYILLKRHLSSEEYLARKIKKSVVNPNQFEFFSKTIGEELMKASAKRYFSSLTQIYAFLTDSWIVYAGREGCFVSSISEIDSISYALMKSGRIELRFKFSIDRTFFATDDSQWFEEFNLHRWFQGEYHGQYIDSQKNR